ncbi:MAG: VOC family protein [Actinomycetota bacterium]|nr:VOC family protein [Actinomycetota bacterium]
MNPNGSGRLDHIALEVGDLDERIALLQRLGMTVRRMGTLNADPSRRIALLADARGFKLELIESSADGFAHIAFEVDDVDAQTAAAPAPLQVQRPPYRMAAAKADSAMLADDGGLTVQFVRYDPDSPDR